MLNKGKILDIFNVLPARIAYLPFKHIMLGKNFSGWTTLLKKNESKTAAEVKEYQFSALKKVVHDAYEHSSFYRMKYDAASFHPDHLKSLDDLPKIPVLTKDELLENADKMVLSGAKKYTLYAAHTSGTTGTPLVIYGDIMSHVREWATVCYIWERAGYKPGDPIIEFRGTVKNNALWERHPEVNTLRINGNRINAGTIREIYNTVKNSGYYFINGYPGAIGKFAGELEIAGLSAPQNITGISLTSEMVYDWQMEKIKAVFSNARILSFYGMTEKAAIAFRAEGDQYYRFIPAYSLVEKDEKTGVLIGTSFVNTIMPIIRYKTSDVLSEEVGAAGAEKAGLFPVIKRIEGREGDFLRKANGELISPATITWPFKYLRHVKNSKIVQDAPDHLTLIIESRAEEKTVIPEANKIIKDLKTIFGDDVKMDFKVTDHILTDASGKFKWLESRMTDKLLNIPGQNAGGKVKIIMSLDYEIFGEGSGDIAKHMISPADRILKICDKFGVPMTIMFEICEYMKFKEFDAQLTEDLGYSPSTLIREQVRAAFKRGHDVQLHMHPQWIGAMYKNKKWILDGLGSDISRYPEDIIGKIVKDGTDELTGLLKDIDGNYKCNTVRFTGYHWLEAPRKTHDILKKNGIKAHSLADHCPEDNRKGYWALADNSLFEIPIHSVVIPKYKALSPRRISLLLQMYRITRDLDGEIRKKVFNMTSGTGKNVLTSLIRETYSQKWDFCKQSANEMLAFLEEGFHRFDHKKHNVPLVMIGHSKDFLNDKEFAKFLRVVTEKYLVAGNIGFSTFRDFVENEIGS